MDGAKPNGPSSSSSSSCPPCGCSALDDHGPAGARGGAAAAVAPVVVGTPPQTQGLGLGRPPMSPSTTAPAAAAAASEGASVSAKMNPAEEGFQVTAAWSVAGVGTCIQLRHKAFGLHIALDMGTSAGEALGANHVFISHSHIDHVGALLNHARARTLSNKPAKYYVPLSAVEPLLQAKAAYEALDGCAFRCEIVGVKPGDVIRIHPNVRVVVFPTLHRVPSQGYAFVRERSLGLKPEYRSLSSRDLGLLRKQGQEVVDVEDVVEAAYTGDTKLDAVLGLDLVTRARLLVVECTYLEGEVVWAHKWHHVHIKEIVQHAARFRNERVVLCHVSRKYKLHDNVLSLVRAALAPCPQLAARVGVTLAGFGRLEPVTYLTDYEAEEALQQQQQQQQGAPLGTSPGAGTVGYLMGHSPPAAAGAGAAGGGGGGGAWRGQQQQYSVLGADGGLEAEEMPEVRTKEEARRMLRVMSEDLGLRPRAESLAGEIEESASAGVGAASGAGTGTGMGHEVEVEEPSLSF